MSPVEARILIITGLQRSGSTALGEFLGCQEGVVYLGEIFHPDCTGDLERARRLRLRPEVGFYKFLNEDAPQDLSKGVPTRERRSALWKAYRAFLAERYPNKTIVVDIKCNSWRNLDDCWSTMTGPPLLLELVALETSSQIIHLIRRDEIARLASLFVAGTNDIYHLAAEEKSIHPEVYGVRSIDIEWAKLYVEQCRAETSMLEACLPTDNCLRIFYEDVFDSCGFLTDSTIEALSFFLRMPILQVPPVLQRVAADPREWITNWQLLAEALRSLQ